MKPRYLLAGGLLAALPIVGSGVAYATETNTPTSPASAQTLQSQALPDTGTSVTDPGGDIGPDVQSGPDVNVESGSQSGGPDTVTESSAPGA